MKSQRAKIIQRGTYADGSIDKFISRIKSKVNDKRLNFLLGEITEDVTFEDTLKHLIAYEETKHSNITIIDLSGVPFDVLSITVSLISRIIFELGFVKLFALFIFICRYSKWSKTKRSN